MWSQEKLKAIDVETKNFIVYCNVILKPHQ